MQPLVIQLVTGNDAVTTAGGLGVQTYAATGVATPGTITAAQGGTNGSGSFSFLTVIHTG